MQPAVIQYQQQRNWIAVVNFSQAVRQVLRSNLYGYPSSY